MVRNISDNTQNFSLGCPLCFLVLTIDVCEVLLDKIGLETYIDYGEAVVVSNSYYDEVKTGDYTDAGVAINIIILMCSFKIFRIIRKNRFSYYLIKKKLFSTLCL